MASSEMFVHPDGDLLETWFPGGQIDIAAWISGAEELRLTTNPQIEAYVYYRAYGYLYRVYVLGDPAKQSLEYESFEFTPAQLDRFTEQYELYKSAVAGFLPSAVVAYGSGGAVLTSMES